MELYKSIFTTGLPRLMLPLFPLKLAVLPKEVLPLHIFEDRYKEMIAECISGDSLFGMIYREKGEFSKIGCAVKVYKTLNKYEDGKYDILIKGCYRFKVINYMKKNNLWYGEIKEIDEHYDLMDPKIFNYIFSNFIDFLAKIFISFKFCNSKLFFLNKKFFYTTLYFFIFFF